MRILLALAAAAAVAAPLTVSADDLNPAVKARRAYFTLLGANMGPLAAMAKGERDYDEAVAAAHAANIEALAAYNASYHFPEGTAAMDLPGQTRAKADIWMDMEGFGAKAAAFQQAAAGAAEAVKGGRENLGARLQMLGKSCKGCHDDYRNEDF